MKKELNLKLYFYGWANGHLRHLSPLFFFDKDNFIFEKHSLTTEYLIFN